MEIWGTLSSRPLRWPRDSATLSSFDAIRVILKGEVAAMLARHDRSLVAKLDRIRASGVRVYFDLPGERLSVADSVASQTLLRMQEVELIDAGAPPTASRVRINGLASCLTSVRPGAEIMIADGAVAGYVKSVTRLGIKVAVQGRDELDLCNRSLSISGVSACSASPRQADLDLVSILRSHRLAADGILLSFAEDAEQIERVRAVAGPDLPVVPKIESKRGVENAAELMTGCAYCVVGRSDLLVDLGPLSLTESVTKVITSVRRAGGSTIVASGIGGSLIRRPSLDIADLSDLAYLRWARADGVMISGSVSELRLAEAGQAVREMYTAITRPGRPSAPIAPQ